MREEVLTLLASASALPFNGHGRCVKGRDASTPPACARERAPVMDDNPTRRQTCSWENLRVPFGFKDSMIH